MNMGNVAEKEIKIGFILQPWISINPLNEMFRSISGGVEKQC